MMAFEELFEKVSELAQTGVAKAKEFTDAGMAKTKELAEISKLKVENASEQESIKKAYLEIGKLYFAERGMAPESPYTALCEKIADSKSKIEYNQERIADIKAASGLKDEEIVFVETEIPAEEPVQGAAAPEEPIVPETPSDDIPSTPEV